jgi:hypothetical protein
MSKIENPKIIYIGFLFFSKKSIRFSKMDKNKCPKFKNQNTFLKKHAVLAF